jgi:hypothetical protein
MSTTTHQKERQVRVTRRGLQIALGLVWLLDAALQFQPYMFSHDFATQIIAPVGPGNPVWIAGPVAWTATQIGQHVVLANASFATIQLAVGAGILWPRTTRLALAASVPWAIGVWWLGEGLGGLLTSSASPLNGAPGAVIIYAVLAVLLWPSGPAGDSPSVADQSPIGTAGARVAWLVLWYALAMECLAPSFRPPDAVGNTILGMSAGEPGWRSAVDRGVGDALLGRGALASVLLAVVLTAVAAAVFVPAASRPVLIAAIVVSLLIWVVPENFGGIATGTGTDPNTGPLLVLLALAYWPRRLQSEQEASQIALVPQAAQG